MCCAVIYAEDGIPQERNIHDGGAAMIDQSLWYLPLVYVAVAVVILAIFLVAGLLDVY
jgi:hypothetical protein